MSIEIKLADFRDKYSLPETAIEELKTILDSVIVDFAHKIINNEPKKTMPKLDTSTVINTKKKFATKIADEYASECGVTLEEIPCETGKVTKKDIERYVKNKISTGEKSKSTSKSKSKSTQGVSPELEEDPKISLCNSDTEYTSKSKSKSKSKSVSKSVSKKPSKTDFETESESESEKKIISKKEKNGGIKDKCNGITKDGNPCNLNASKIPDGSKKCYCFRHALDWKQYEVSSDSDYEGDGDEGDENETVKEDNAEIINIHRDLAIVTED
jgi:hypothetical protein